MPFGIAPLFHLLADFRLRLDYLLAMWSDTVSE